MLVTVSKSKATLNKLHFEESQKREEGTNRSALENDIALFDECLAIIVADDEKYLELIRNHQWKDIFWNNKQNCDKLIQTMCLATRCMKKH